MISWENFTAGVIIGSMIGFVITAYWIIRQLGIGDKAEDESETP